MADLGRWYAGCTARHVGMPPHDSIRMTVEAQGGGSAVFVHCDFSRAVWKGLIDQLSNDLFANRVVHPAEVPDHPLAAVAKAVASWTVVHEPAQRSELRVKVSDLKVEIRLNNGLLIFALSHWTQMVVEMHAAWSEPPDTSEWFQPIQ